MVPRPVVAEEEVAALDHSPRLETAPNDLVEEFLRFQLQESQIGRIGHHRVDAQFLQELGLPLGQGQGGGSLLRPEQPRRVRIERQDHGRAAQTPGHGQESLDNPRMPQMHSVEVANRDGTAAQSLGQVVQGTK